MSQATVTKFYNTRKCLKDNVKGVNKLKNTQINLEDELKSRKALPSSQDDNFTKDEKDNRNARLAQLPASVSAPKQKTAPKTNSTRTKVSKTTKGTKKGKTNQTTVTKFYQSVNSSSVNERELCTPKELNLLKDELQGNSSSTPEEIIREKCKDQQETAEQSLNLAVSEATSNKSFKPKDLNRDARVLPNVETIKSNITRSPKRTIPIPCELTPSKKKPHISVENDSLSPVVTPRKTKDVPASRKLDMNFLTSPSKASYSLHSPVKNQVSSPRKILSPKEKLDAMIDQSRSKLLLSPNREELRKSLESFSKKVSKMKEFHSNPHKITSVISPAQSKSNSSTISSTPAHERFSHLAAPDTSSLILPFKFRLLADMFRSMDTVVSILHNRKEKITFDKVQDGVQKMMKRNFSKTHLGQIVAVMPSAYSFTIEKCNFMNKKADSGDYQLVITPVLTDEDLKSKKSKSVTFQPMHPQFLIDRRSDFHEALLKITKKHHQEFLNRLNFPLVPEDRLKRWHPKFPVDSVLDILPAQLPEPQENKIYTAKDVLNKVKGTLRNKVEKALQSVADESKKDVTLELKDISSSKPETSKAALKGICTDLLEKIRARESTKLLEAMTRTPDETKRLAMMERLPKIIHILWHYFIAERKAAVPIDVAVEKIIHSFNSLSTPDDVKEHLKLITETFPGWLSFIEITKGVYIRIDKKRNINEMLDLPTTQAFFKS